MTAETQTGSRIPPRIAYWDAGSPAYRWMDLISNRILSVQTVSAFNHRAYTYVAMALHDATVAAWDSKYAYNRPRPSVLDPTINPSLPVPNSPSYPSEHAAAAAAAAEVLAYLVPAEAASFRALAEEAGRSRLYAGLLIPQRLRRRDGLGPPGCRCGHSQSQSRWFRRRMGRHGSNGQVHVDRHQPGQCHRHHLEAIPAGLAYRNSGRPPRPPGIHPRWPRKLPTFATSRAL